AQRRNCSTAITPSVAISTSRTANDGFSYTRRFRAHSPQRQTKYTPKIVPKIQPSPHTTQRVRTARRWLARSLTSSTCSRSSRRFFVRRLNHAICQTLYPTHRSNPSTSLQRQLHHSLAQLRISNPRRRSRFGQQTRLRHPRQRVHFKHNRLAIWPHHHIHPRIVAPANRLK